MDPDLDGCENKGRFYFACPFSLSSFCDFFFLPKIRGGGGGSLVPRARPLDPPLGLMLTSNNMCGEVSAFSGRVRSLCIALEMLLVCRNC